MLQNVFWDYCPETHNHFMSLHTKKWTFFPEIRKLSHHQSITQEKY